MNHNLYMEEQGQRGAVECTLGVRHEVKGVVAVR
jgi:hypothetical protein